METCREWRERSIIRSLTRAGGGKARSGPVMCVTTRYKLQCYESRRRVVTRETSGLTSRKSPGCDKLIYAESIAIYGVQSLEKRDNRHN